MNRTSANALEEFFRDRRRQVLWEAEGIESSLALIADKDLVFLLNGKADGSARGDAATQVMFALMGALIHPLPQRSFVVGLGTGTTAGWLADVPSMEQVEVVELEPQVARVAEACAPVNRNALANPKLRLRFGDAREVMLTTDQTYDLIASEPSNPYRAGVSSLYTLEFYRAVAKRLRPGGLFVQWVQGYEVDGASVRTIYATMASVFAGLDTWKTECGDLFFLAALQPITYDLAQVRRRLGEEPYRSALLVPWQTFDLEGVFAHFVGGSGLARAALAGGAPVNTDDRNRLEFGLARALGRETDFGYPTLQRMAIEERCAQPVVTEGALDLVALADRRVSLSLLEHVANISLQSSHAGLQARTAAKAASTRDDWPAVLRHWRAQTNEPGDLMELTILARAAAKTADPAAPRYLERLRALRPADAEALTGHYLAAQGQAAAAMTHLERSLRMWREDPWVSLKLAEDTLALVRTFPREAAGRAALERLYHALAEPFAVRLVEQARWGARLDVARHLEEPGFGEFTRQALAACEPHAPWRQDLLALRAQCYAELRDARATLARRELARFSGRGARPVESTAKRGSSGSGPNPAITPPAGPPLQAATAP
jgi:spermidine synthase